MNLLLFSASKDQKKYFSSLEKVANERGLWTIHIHYKHVVAPALPRTVPWHDLKRIVGVLKTRKQKVKARPNWFWLLWQPFVQAQALFLYLKYHRLVAQYANHTIGVWNGKKYRQSLCTLAAKALGRPVLFFEIGPLPGYSVVDPKGLNAYSSLPREKAFYDSLPLDRSLVPNINPISTPSDVFIPFQVLEDSNIYLHSPWIHDMPHLVSLIDRLSADFPSITFTFKPHPACSVNYQHLMDQYRHNLQIQFVQNQTTASLIQDSDAIITINSTVGIEALSAGKPVIVLGDALYAIDGLTHQVQQEDQLKGALTAALTQPINTTLVAQYLTYVRDQYAVPGNAMKSPDHTHFQAMVDKIKSLG